MPKTYTVKEVADILGFSTNSIYTFLKEKRIRGVRIGKGRFRIPEEELVRILHLSKKPKTSFPTTPLVKEESESVVMVREQDVLCPNLFDWFVGLGAIVSGLGMFLFNSSYTRPELSGFSNAVFAIRLILIATGCGVVASAILTSAKGWHRVFHGILAFLGAMNAVSLYRGGDIDGSILYGAMAVVLALGFIVHAEGVTFFGIYMSMLAVLFPLWIFVFASTPAVQTAAYVVGISPSWFGIAVSVVSMCCLVLYWIGYSGKRVPRIVAGGIAATLCFGGAVWYGEMQYWSRAFFLIVLGFFVGVMPHWQWFCDATPRRQRLLLHGLLGGIGVVLFSAVLVVYLLQQNMWEQSKTEFLNRVSAAQNLLLSTIDAAQSSAVVTAGNQEVADALVARDTSVLIQTSKLLYESNSVIRRVVFLDASGNGASLYPYGTFDQKSYASREYFIQARDTKFVYVSNVFQAAVDNAGRYVLVISVPLFSSKGSFAGVMAVSVDLERLGLKLRQLAVETRGEYFIIVDGNKTILSHPDAKWIGKALLKDDILYTSLSGAKGVAGGVLPNGLLGLVAYESVDQLGWMITLRAPITQIYALTSNVAIWVFGTVTAAMIAAVGLAFFLKFRWVGQSGGGP